MKSKNEQENNQKTFEEQTVFTENEAIEYGAFVETALSEKDAIESNDND